MPWQTQNLAAGKEELARGEAFVVLGTSVSLLGLEPPSPKSLPEDVTPGRFPDQEELRQPPALPRPRGSALGTLAWVCSSL